MASLTFVNYHIRSEARVTALPRAPHPDPHPLFPNTVPLRRAIKCSACRLPHQSGTLTVSNGGGRLMQGSRHLSTATVRATDLAKACELLKFWVAGIMRSIFSTKRPLRQEEAKADGLKTCPG
jgi:hypothetical protein